MFGEVPKWPKGTGCKPAGSAFEGSNPSLSTINRVFRTEDGNAGIFGSGCHSILIL